MFSSDRTNSLAPESHEPCAQCGGIIANGETCADRFAMLLALDHSHQQPWGALHGVAFSVYTLQHPDDSTAAGLNRCWSFLQRVYVHGEEPVQVANWFRTAHAAKSVSSKATELPNMKNPPRSFDVTIASMGDFEAQSYQQMLDAWCTCTIHAWTHRQ